MFITFEGVEGCGKSTQAERLFERSKTFGVPIVFTREPGGTRLGMNIRRILLDSRNRELTPLAELFLYAADRAQHVAEVIKPALARGHWVVCDRFFDATTVYQGHARRQDMNLIDLLNEKATHGIQPDMTFLLDCPVEIGLARAKDRNKMLAQEQQGRFEDERRHFHEAVRQGYLKLADEYEKRFVVLDGTLGEDRLEEMIFERVKPFLPIAGS